MRINAGCNLSWMPPVGFKPSGVSSAAVAQPHAHSIMNTLDLEQKLRIINIVDEE
jgi:hypothetical protein